MSERLESSNRKAVQGWFDPAEIREINQFRREQEQIPSLGAALRLLVMLGLAETKKRNRSAAAAE